MTHRRKSAGVPVSADGGFGCVCMERFAPLLRRGRIRFRAEMVVSTQKFALPWTLRPGRTDLGQVEVTAQRADTLVGFGRFGHSLRLRSGRLCSTPLTLMFLTNAFDLNVFDLPVFDLLFLTNVYFAKINFKSVATKPA